MWVLAVAGAFLVDRWVYQTVSREVCVTTGFKPWRFAAPYGGRATALEEALALFKRMGHSFFAVLLSVTMLVLAPRRRRQVLLLWLCILVSALVSEGILKPGVGKLRPDVALTEEQATDLERRWGEEATVAYGSARANTGHALFRPVPERFREHGGLTFPSGHATMAFALFAALGAFFPRGRRWFLILAAGVAVSRVLIGDHFLSDAIAGGGIGYAIARILLARPRLRRYAGLEADG